MLYNETLAESSSNPLLPPIISKIAQCESSGKQFNPDGSVLRGKVNPHDVGVLQINETYHLKRSKELGFDIYTLEGNLGYGLTLLKENGTQPWKASEHCWSK